jgi:hypothetical protein
MAGVAQLVELWIVIPMLPSDISDLTPKPVRTFADKIRMELGILLGRCLNVRNPSLILHIQTPSK